MAPFPGVAGAMATYQRLSTLLRTLRQPSTTCGLREKRKNMTTFSSHNPSTFSTLRRSYGFPVPLWPYGVVPRVQWGSRDILTPLRGTWHPCNSLYQMKYRLLHSSSSSRQKDIPEYLLGSISEVDTAEDDLLGDDFEEEEEEEEEEEKMEDEILDFLTPRLIPFEETDSSFVIPCPGCTNERDEDDDKMKEIFVDKNSGYFVCPWCCRDGGWGELRALLDSREDTITTTTTTAALTSVFNTTATTTTPISHLHDEVLKDSPLRGVSRVTLDKCGAVVTSDGSRLILPVRDGAGQLVGLENVSLMHQHPQIIRRYLVGKSRAFTPLPLSTASSRNNRVLVVPNCCDVLALYELKIPAVSLPLDDVSALERHLVECGTVGEVVLWCQALPPPRPLLLALIKAGVSCSIVQSVEGDPPIHLMTPAQVRAALTRTLAVLSPATTTFTQLRDKVYYRLTHREETSGVQWQRYRGLNDLLLGHRAGELTVLTGPTGAGKTTLVAEYSLDLCMQGVRTLWGSFEVGVVRLCEVMLQQFSGAPLPQDLQLFNALAGQFAALPLHFLTYHGQRSVGDVVKAMEEAVQVWGIQHAIIDNLQFMLGTPLTTTTTTTATLDRWHQQDLAVAMLRRFATTTGCHLTLIVHPKKVPEGQPLGMDSVYGSAKVTQEADNVMILQVPSSGGGATTSNRKVLQVAKNRFGGTLGDLPLRFHKDSLTLSSCFSKSKTRAREGAEGSGKEGDRKGGSLRRLKLKGLV
ncbi:mitochondrial DNA helicase-like [Eriocheir sinensis]|uniref:mitochondrial DNA helicase-like n=1 Tax=Eriocheir sinensis TaxID=95602 RepID=UPI0021C9DA1F|nr:mitochondrial DNA helicase-like [Eriocheir sinensis]